MLFAHIFRPLRVPPANHFQPLGEIIHPREIIHPSSGPAHHPQGRPTILGRHKPSSAYLPSSGNPTPSSGAPHPRPEPRTLVPEPHTLVPEPTSSSRSRHPHPGVVLSSTACHTGSAAPRSGQSANEIDPKKFPLNFSQDHGKFDVSRVPPFC